MRSEGIEKEVHRRGMQVADKYGFDDAFLGKPTDVFRDQVTLDGMVN